uniref:Myb-like domain-containing protein n=1 Tax=Arabidopsis lyrata subsp. lyrata TaxID=81972 RepID=B2BXI5_ARALL|nr:unknown [Arabidopsis lyrata subsp. lyrata]
MEALGLKKQCSCVMFFNMNVSQQERGSLNPNACESASPSIRLGESDLPAYSTQWTEATEATTQGGSAKAKSTPRKRNKWTSQEDLVLISAWLNTSKDAIVGNEQRGVAFWKRIAAYYAASPNISGEKKREPTHFKQRWAKINEQVCKFVGSFQAAAGQVSSGMNDDDLIKLAHQIFEADYDNKFNLEHAWRALRNEQKWCQEQSTKSTDKNKRRKVDSEASQAHNESQASQSRPAGVKAAKAKLKKPATTAPLVEEEGQAVERIQALWEIRQKEFALKQQEHAFRKELTNSKLLDSLLSKSDPLSEIEEELKNKLIRNILL